jgi:branched-chain amino acid transport system permease protein
MIESALVTLLNGLSYGLLLFLLSAGLTLIFGLMGVLNFAHASFYMLGAYVAYAVMGVAGFAVALVAAPVGGFLVGAAFERLCLRQVRRAGHLPEMLLTFGLSFLMLEAVQVVWGRAAVDLRVPDALDGPLFVLGGLQFPVYRAFMMAMALLVLAVLWWTLRRTRIGLVITAAVSHPHMVQALGHDVPKVMTLVFGGGCALAALAGAIGGVAYVTEPGMAAAVGPIVFVIVVIGGLGSLGGALVASLLIGVLQTAAVAADVSVNNLLAVLGLGVPPGHWAHPWLALELGDAAPMLPFLLLVVMLALRPQGLAGRRWS